MYETTDPAGRPVAFPDGVDPEAIDTMRDRHAAQLGTERVEPVPMPTVDAPSTLTPCGPLCDQQHMVSQPHNRNRAPIQPQDHQPKGNPQRDEAEDRAVTFPWDGDEWTFNMADATSLEFLAALDDAESDEDPLGMVRAARILLGREQAARLFKGRQVTDIFDFFTVAGEAGGTGNR